MGEHAQALDASGLSAATVTFWTAWQGDVLVDWCAEAAGIDARRSEIDALRPLRGGPELGVPFCRHIIAEGRQRGYVRLSLETGTAPLHAAAISLYRSVGFVPCEPFADYRASPHNQFMRLDLLH